MSESIVILDRIGSSPRDRGSATGQTCPDFLALEGGVTGVIGEVRNDTSELDPAEAHVVVPATLVYDAFAAYLRS